MKAINNIKAVFAALALAPLLAWGQSFPSKPIRIVVPFGPGGVADITARTVAPEMAKDLGQQVVIENKPSAGGIVAGQDVSRSAPDGHTLLLVSNGTAVSQALFKSLNYDPQGMAMVSTLGSFPLIILTESKSQFQDLKGLIAFLKANPGKANAGTIGVGSTQNLAAQLFKSTAGVDFQIVPYKNTGEVVTAARNGDAHVIFEIVAPMVPHIKSGALRALAVTGAKRFGSLPDVPTAIEQGIAGYDVTSWNGLAAPAGTPPAVVERLHASVAKALAVPEVQQRLAGLGVEPRASSPAELKDFYASEAKRWAQVVERAGIPRQ